MVLEQVCLTCTLIRRTQLALPTDSLLERCADLLKLVCTESAFEELPMKDWESKTCLGSVILLDGSYPPQTRLGSC